MKINKQKTELNSFRDVLQDANQYDKSWDEIQDLIAFLFSRNKPP